MQGARVSCRVSHVGRCGCGVVVVVGRRRRRPSGELHLELRELLEVHAEVGAEHHLHHQRSELLTFADRQILEYVVLGDGKGAQQG